MVEQVSDDELRRQYRIKMPGPEIRVRREFGPDPAWYETGWAIAIGCAIGAVLVLIAGRL